MGAWRRDRARHRGLVAAVTAVLAVTAVPFTAAPAQAAPTVAGDIVTVVANPGGRLAEPVGAGLASSVIDPTVVVQLSDPGVELTAPVDGRLRGDGVALIVTGAALSDQAGVGDEAVSAGTGEHLIVFGLRQVPQPEAPNAPPADLALVVAGQRRSIDLADLAGSGPWYFAASVPAGATDVDLELTATGYAQRFSFLTLTRLGPTPAVLYRDPDNPEVLDTDDSAVAVAVTAGPPISTTYSLQVAAATTTLSWFAPDASADTPSAPDQAFLAVQLTTETLIDPADSVVVELLWPSPVPVDHLQLVLPDGTRVGAAHVDAAQDVPGVSVNLFSGIYYFAVPADVAAATLSVGSYGAPGQAGELLPADTTITVSAFTIALPLSAPPAPPPAATTPPTVLKLTNARAARVTATPGGAGDPDPFHATGAAGGLILLVTAVGAGWFAVHRRRRPAIEAVTRVQPAWTPPPGAFPPPGPTRPAPDRRQAVTAPSIAPVTESPPVEPLPVAPTVPPPVRLAAVPSGPPAPPPGQLYVGVLGPFQVTGWPDDQAPSASVVELATYLVLHPDRPRTAEELRDPLSAGKAKALSADTIRTYANSLRRCLGPEQLPDAARRGYTITEASSDWERFIEQCDRVGDDAEPAAEAEALAGALVLIRGQPYSELPKTGYGWVATELLISEVEVAVTRTAQRLSDLALTAGDWVLAAWAADRGLVVDPISEDLNAAALRAASATGKIDRVAQTWREIARRYAATNEDMPPGLVDLNSQLKQLR